MSWFSIIRTPSVKEIGFATEETYIKVYLAAYCNNREEPPIYEGETYTITKQLLPGDMLYYMLYFQVPDSKYTVTDIKLVDVPEWLVPKFEKITLATADTAVIYAQSVQPTLSTPYSVAVTNPQQNGTVVTFQSPLPSNPDGYHGMRLLIPLYFADDENQNVLMDQDIEILCRVMLYE